MLHARVKIGFFMGLFILFSVWLPFFVTISYTRFRFLCLPTLFPFLSICLSISVFSSALPFQ